MPDQAKTPPNVIDDQSGGATDQRGMGPTSIAGAEASELPDHGRGGPETNIGKEMGRKLPGETGGLVGSGTEVGLAGDPDPSKARDHGPGGGRGKN